MIKRVLVGIVLLALIQSSVFAEEIINSTGFGVCEVMSLVDEFTDDVSYHLLMCGGQNFIALACFPNKDDYLNPAWTTAVKIAGQYYTEYANVPVRVRFDRRDAFSDLWIADHANRVITYNIPSALGFLDDLKASENTILISLEREVRGIDITNTDGPGAVEEINRRCYPTEEEPVQEM